MKLGFIFTLPYEGNKLVISIDNCMRKWLEAKPGAILPFLSAIIPKLHEKPINHMTLEE